jgi:hypothetical protein
MSDAEIELLNSEAELLQGNKQSWLPNWKHKPTLMEMQRNYNGAKPDRDMYVGKINAWLDNFHIRGNAKIKEIKGFSSVQPKVIRKQAEWRYAPLSEPFLSTPDLFVASPVSWEDKEGAMQHQLLLNNQFSTVINRVNFIDEYVRTAVDEGTVIVRVGWDFQEGEVTEEIPEYTFVPIKSEESMAELTAAMNGQRHHMPEWDAAVEQSKLAGEPLEPQFIKYQTRTRTKVLVNQPTVEVVITQNLTVDPTCMGDISKAGFIVYAFETSIADLSKSGRYHDLDKINISPGKPRTDAEFLAMGDTSFNFNDKDQTKIVAYEYWGYHDIDGSGTLKPYVATWVGDILIRMEDNPFPDGKHPFVSVQYLPIRKSIYGEPDGALIEDNQKIIGALTRGMVDAMGRSANGQMGVHKGALDPVNKRKFDAGQDYEFNGNITPDRAFYMHKYPEIPNSAPLMLQFQNNEADSFTGVKAFAGGLSGDALGRTSAAGVRGVLDAASKREVNILRRLANGIVEIGKKIISMNTEFLNDIEIIRVTNENFVPIQRDKLIGKYDLKLSISTAEEDVAKAEELAFMLQTIGNTIGAGLAQTILADIARLRKMPDLAKKIENYAPEPDPIAQEMAMLELEELRATIMERQAAAQERMAQAQLNMAKANTEQVKQGNIQSTTDLNNLDLVEQESGVKQERELEKSKAQAKGNMQLKLFDKTLDGVLNPTDAPKSGK